MSVLLQLPRAAIVNLPNFFIVGTQKAGTTSLYHYLGQHPDIFVSPIKEPGYFAPEQTPEKHRFSWERYQALFADVSHEQAIGEATATYLWSHTAAQNIAAHIPSARIIIVLRNPIERAFSQYLHMRSAGATQRSFRDQINHALTTPPGEFGLEWPFLELGRYGEQLPRYFASFPRSQIHIALYEDFERSAIQLAQELFAFLGVAADFTPDVSHRHNVPRVHRLPGLVSALRKSAAWPHLRQLVPVGLRGGTLSLLAHRRRPLCIDRSDRAFLAEYYADDIARLSSLLQRDFRHWLAPSPPQHPH
ncbi:MAG: sulfotransferase [Proteobacteria bacterium]|nr:sulfotransferase [Pseudomonadota bacterium]